MNNTNVNHYAVLGVHPTADYDTIKRAYRKLVYKYHPNKSKNNNINEDNDDDDDDDDSEATTLLQQYRQIKESFEVLGDYNRRVMYDTYMYQEQHQQCTTFHPDFGNNSRHRGINTAHCFVQPSSRFEQCAHQQQQQHGNKRGGGGGGGHCNCHQYQASSWYLHSHIDYLKWNIHLLEESNIKLMNDLTHEREQSREKIETLLLERTKQQQQQQQQQQQHEQKITATMTKEFSQQQTTPTAAVLLSPSTKENVGSNLVGKQFIDNKSSMMIKKNTSTSRRTMTTRSGNIRANDVLVRRRRPLGEVVNNTNEEKEDFFEL